jgi:hypothetical protein
VTVTGRVTSELLWRATLIAVLIDVPLLVLVARGVSPRLFRELEWHLAAAASVVYAVLWGTFGSVYSGMRSTGQCFRPGLDGGFPSATACCSGPWASRSGA